MIRVACPHCRRTYRTMTEGMGKIAVCTKCGQSFRIGSARPTFEWKPSDLGEDSWIGVAPPEEKKELKHCIMCQAPLEEGSVSCLACGANQVTGVVHRPKPKVQEVKAPIWSVLPIKPLLITGCAAAVVLSLWWGVKAMFSSVADSGVELAQQRVVMEAARFLADGGDEYAFPGRFSGKVNDENLPRFLMMLGARDVNARQAAPLLIACGRVTQVAPIVEQTKSKDDTIAQGAVQVLQAIGPRRLVELSGNADAAVRRSAAKALGVLFELKADAASAGSLADPVPTDEKTARLNRLCRPWPQAVGTFALTIGETEAPFEAIIEQIGRTFYLQVGSGEFRSSFSKERTIIIPIERWCAATGVAVDPKEIRNWMSGSVTLVSLFGSGWEGAVLLTARRDLTEPPPGFLPVGSLKRDQAVNLPIALRRR